MIEFRKNRSSGFVWFLYACTVCICLTKVVAEMVADLQMELEYNFLFTVAFVVLPVLLLYQPVRLIIGRRKVRTLHRTKVWMPVAAVVLLSLAGAGLRIGFVLSRMNRTMLLERSSEELAALMQWRERMAAGQVLPGIYGLLLTLSGSLGLGMETGGFWLNVLLQSSAVCFLMLALFFLSGQKACVGAGIFLVIPVFLLQGCALAQPQNLVLFAGAFLFFLCAAALRLRSGRQKAAGIVTALTALVCGIAVLGEGRMVLLLLFLFVGSLGLVKGKGGNKALLLIQIALPAAAGFLAAFFLLWYVWNSQMAVTEFLGQWQEQLLQVFFQRWSTETTLADYLTYLAVIPFCLFYLFGVSGRRENSGFPLVLPLLGVMIWESAAGTVFQEQYFGYLFLAAFGGLGVSNLFARPSLETAEREDPLADVPDVEELDAETETVPERSKQTAEKEIPEETAKPKAVKEIPEETPEIPSEIPPGQYLPNPLPVPKRKAHREMNYAFEPEDDAMCFDYATSDDDDFDL